MYPFYQKKRNSCILLYHIVCSAKYGQVMFTKEINDSINDVCQSISRQFRIQFIEIGVEENDIHFLFQAPLNIRLSQVVKVIKMLTAREIYYQMPNLRESERIGELWKNGCSVHTMGKLDYEEFCRRITLGRNQDYLRIYTEDGVYWE